MNEREVVVYFQAALETHKFTASRKADQSSLMLFFIDSLMFNLDVELL